jgi:hypothetical protein
MTVSPLRYFLAVLHPAHGLAALIVIAALGLWMIVISPGELDSALGLLLVAQMFLASSGLLVRARRGHFDQVLTSRPDRRSILVCHWIASVAHVVAAWVVLSGVAWALGNTTSAVSALVGPRLVALFVVSAIAWAAGIGFSRGSVGALWTMGLVAALLYHGNLLGSPPGPHLIASTVAVMRHALVLLGCPFLLLGSKPPLVPGSVPAAACAAWLVLLLVWRSSEKFDLYLRERG